MDSSLTNSTFSFNEMDSSLTTLTTSAYTFKSPRKQYFSFPFYVITHLWKYPLSAEGLEKLYKTCKYFFYKNKILIKTYPEKIPSGYVMGDDIEFKKLMDSKHPLWINSRLFISPDFMPKFEKIYRCTLKILIIENVKKISLKEFDILTSSKTIKVFELNYAYVKENEVDVPVEVILGKLPNVIELKYRNLQNYSFQTFQKMNEIVFLNKFQHLSLWMRGVEENFDSKLVCDFIKKNVASGAEVFLPVNLQPFLHGLHFGIKDLLKEWKGKKPIFYCG